MKITYEFADGTRSEAEVDEELGKEILESRRKEENLERKERYHSAYSLDGCEYEGEDFAFEADPLEDLLRMEYSAELRRKLKKLSKVQLRRLQMRLDGLNIREIARTEGVSHVAILVSFAAIEKRIKET